MKTQAIRTSINLEKRGVRIPREIRDTDSARRRVEKKLGVKLKIDGCKADADFFTW